MAKTGSDFTDTFRILGKYTIANKNPHDNEDNTE